MWNNIHVFVIILKTNFSSLDNYSRSELNLDTPYKSHCSLWSVAIIRRERRRWSTRNRRKLNKRWMFFPYVLSVQIASSAWIKKCNICLIRIVVSIFVSTRISSVRVRVTLKPIQNKNVRLCFKNKVFSRRFNSVAIRDIKHVDETRIVSKQSSYKSTVVVVLVRIENAHYHCGSPW